MTKTSRKTYSGSFMRRLAWLGCLMLVLSLTIAGPVWAAPPSQEGAEQCADCHEEETDAWHSSPHALAAGKAGGVPGATCEDCHGPYVEDHPEAGIMQLNADSSVCKDCHAGTFAQWKGTVHADAGVQCIGCHLSHSQEFRLTDQDLCGSCHRERMADFEYTAHDLNGVACIDCHASSATNTENVVFISDGNAEVPKSIPAASHDFTHVTSEDCISCHGQDAHTALPEGEMVTDARLLSMAESVPDLTAKLENTQQEIESLQIMTPVALGLGMGLGGMMGVIFMLVIGYVTQRRSEK
jgi:formate-dependent nitrite reductase cytochrome c552 subunit